jgi:hypothetical protein
MSLTGILPLVVAILVSGSGFAFSAWFAWDMWKAGGPWALYAELTRIALARPAPEAHGWPGWTPELRARFDIGVDPATGGPRHDETAAGLRESNGRPA